MKGFIKREVNSFGLRPRGAEDESVHTCERESPPLFCHIEAKQPSLF